MHPDQKYDKRGERSLAFYADLIKSPGPQGIKVDREKLTEEVIRLAGDLPYPLRLSEAFMKLWCGTHGPTEELEAYLRERGLRFIPGTDIQAGWDVRRGWEQDEQGVFQLL